MADNNDTQHAEMHRIDAEKRTAQSLKARDAELYILLGGFLLCLGLPVILGTWYAMAAGRTHGAVINLIAGVVLSAWGITGMVYGMAIRRGMTEKP
ncbi:MAG TPA: hypothetical protein PK349_10180 [Candidatus Hydrogenedentes bacterium]|nr:hypothetical protein [Candidatus Hydrogenedentota bacterium]